MDRPGREAAGRVEHDEPDTSQQVLDLAPEDPQVQQVARQMQQASVQEHRGEGRQPDPLLRGGRLCRAAQELPRHESPAVEQQGAGIGSDRNGVREGQGVRGDDRENDPGCRPPGYVVANGNHHEPQYRTWTIATDGQPGPPPTPAEFWTLRDAVAPAPR